MVWTETGTPQSSRFHPQEEHASLVTIATTLNTSNPLVLHSLRPICRHIFWRNCPQRLITKEAYQIFNVELPNRITPESLDWFEAKILLGPLAERDRLSTGLLRAWNLARQQLAS